MKEQVNEIPTFRALILRKRLRFNTAGVPIAPRVYSPEGSTLSTLGDTSYESIPDVGSRPPTSTPRDDQSELSFYRRLIQQPRTTRSCEADQRRIGANDRMNSVSECFLGTDKRRPSYRPYSIRDYECLTVPPADRSLGPDPVETRTKVYFDSLMSIAESKVFRFNGKKSDIRKCMQELASTYSPYSRYWWYSFTAGW